MIPRLILLSTLCLCPLAGRAQDAADRDARHQTTEWLTVAPHLPDPATATPASLEQAADVLRARRFPEDALEFYRAALDRGGKRGELLNRIGVTELELRRNSAAKVYFQQALAAEPRSAEGWNNLGAAEYVVGNFQAAVFDYKKALRINKKAAVYHSNLGTAYFEKKDYEGARTQFAYAVKLDPEVFQHGGWGGVDAHVMSPQERGRFCFEMAKLAAQGHNQTGTLLWLGRAAEAGEDILYEMSGVKELIPYRQDPRVTLMVHNAKAMRNGQLAQSNAAPPLPAEEKLN